MFISVIYPDGTSWKVRSSILRSLIQLGKVVAYKCSEGWVEVRRKKDSSDYTGMICILYLSLTVCFKTSLALNVTLRMAFIIISSPVMGFRPLRSVL